MNISAAFSPLAFPNGLILYDLLTTIPTASHAALSPYETFREALVVICIGDAGENVIDDEPGPGHAADMEELQDDLELIAEQLPRALLVQPMFFETTSSVSSSRGAWPTNSILVPSLQDQQFTTMKTVMCVVSARFLAELSTFARSVQESSTIGTPAGTTGTSTPAAVKNGRPLSLLRTTSLRADFSTIDPPSPIDEDDYSDGLPALSEVTSASAEYPESPSTNSQTSPEAANNKERDGRGFSNRRQVSRDSSIDSLNRRDPMEYTERRRLPGISSRKSILRNKPDPAELAEARLTARKALIIGSLYLQSGRWSDALRELTQGAIQARSLDDHFWHAKALENLLVTMLMLTSGGLEFEIPLVCQSGSFRVLASKTSPRTASRSFGTVRPSLDTKTTLLALSSLAPELCRRILDIYIRGFTNLPEVLSRYAFSESIIRLAKLMVYLRGTTGGLDPQVSNDIVTGRQPVTRRGASSQFPGLGKVEIADFLFRAFPTRTIPSPTASTDTISVLSGMSSILGLLGLSRKHAIVNKELLVALVPAIQPSKVLNSGTYQIGGPSSTGNDVSTLDNIALANTELDMATLMEVTGRAYALVQRIDDMPASADDPLTGLARDVVKDVMLNAELRSYGSFNMKLELLQLYTNVAETTSDYHRVVQYTAAILQTVGPQAAPRMTELANQIHLPKEEQIRHFVRLTSSLQHGLRSTGSYWDSFLVRKVELLDPPLRRRLLARSAADLSLEKSSKSDDSVGPFLHDPFLKPQPVQTTQLMLVANEDAEYVVTLQNLFDFEVIVERISLLSDEVHHVQKHIHATLLSCRLHKMILRVRPSGKGTLRIMGCKVKIQGFREQDFFTFDTPWSPEVNPKVGGSGVSAALDIESYPQITGAPVPTIGSYIVLDAQPLASIVSTSLPQAMISILDGEAHRFTITVRNDSSTTTIDFVHLSFRHSMSGSEPVTLSDIEQYEIDYELIHRPIFKWIKADKDGGAIIKPGASKSYEMELRAHTGLKDCSIVVDYARLGMPAEDVKGSFFTRQATLPLTFSSNACIEIEQFDILNSETNDNFLLVIDVRNAWMQPIVATVESKFNAETELGTATDRTQSIIQPGHIARFILNLPKLYIEDSANPIPSLTGGRGRQFVVNKARRASVVEVNSRELFWYRERLLELVTATWRDLQSDRCGDLNLRPLILEPRMLNMIRKDAIGVSLELLDTQLQTRKPDDLATRVDDMFVLRVRLENTTQHDLRPYLQIDPRLANPSAELSHVEMSQCFAWTGQLARPLPNITSGEVICLQFGLVVLNAGDYVIEVSIGEINSNAQIGRQLGSRHLRLSAT